MRGLDSARPASGARPARGAGPARIALAALPVAALLVFFVYPVGGMLARGFWSDGAFDPHAVLEVLARPRVHRVLWFTVWSAAIATAISVALGLPVAGSA